MDKRKGYNDQLKEVANYLSNANKILIISHMGPDGDTLGSALGLYNALKMLKKNIVLYCKDLVPTRYRFLPGADRFISRIPDNESFDVTVLVDHGEVAQAGQEFIDFDGKGTVLNLGHHKYHKPFGKIDLNNFEKASTGIVIYDLIKTMGIELNRDIAICIYTTILTDTGSFHYANTDSEAFSICSKLIRYDIDPWFVAMQIYENYPPEKLYLMREALKNLYISNRGKYGSITIFKDILEKYGKESDLIDGLINLVRGINSVEIAVLFREVEKDIFRVSFRSKGNYNVASIAIAFGGGGHKNSAGCQIEGTYEDVRNKIFQEIERCLYNG